MKFAIISDIHYYTEEMIRDKSHFEAINDKYYEVYKLRRALSLKEIEMVTASDVDTVFVIGDLTDRGDEGSNKEMVGFMQKIKDSGKRVYVLTATHDFNHNRPYTMKHPEKRVYKSKFWEFPYLKPDKFDYRGDLRKHYSHLPDDGIVPEFVKATHFSKLKELYHEFGPSEAISICDSSYCLALDDDNWCLMLNDCFRNNEGITKDCSPTFTPECLEWIGEMVKTAKSQGKFIFACTHHPMVPPAPTYKVGAGTRDMRKAYIGHYLADLGLTLIFTGHTHACDVSFLQSDEGNIMCDITTPSANTYPPQFRIVDLDGKNGKVDIKTVDVELPQGFDLKGLTLSEYLRRYTYERIEYDLADMLPPAYKIVKFLIDKWKVKHTYFLCKHACGMTRQEYAKIKDVNMYELITTCAANMMSGDGKYTPDTPEYKLMMGFAAMLDSMLDAVPFFDVRKKFLCGYSARELIEPLLFNNGVPDGTACFDFTKLPQKVYETKEYSSNAGILFSIAFGLISIPICALAVPTLPILIPSLYIRKRINKYKNPTLPERY